MTTNYHNTKNVYVIGCGGVGSHIAYLLARDPGFEKIHLVDFDIVENKNLERQLFTIANVGQKKCVALKSFLDSFNTGKTIIAMDIKITDSVDLAMFDKYSPAIICTDNLESKRKLAQHFEHFVIINCEKDYFEVKTEMDSEEKHAWQIGSGYTSTQTFTSNVYSAFFAYLMILRGMGLIRKISIPALNSKLMDSSRET
jgi:hypothetical protein